MELPVITAIVLLLAWAGLLSARLGCYKKQMKHLLQELEIAEQDDTNILFTSIAHIGQTEAVISALNHIMDKNRLVKERLLRENHSYRESITSISHDIRTPLTSAKGYMQLLRSQNVPLQKRLEYAAIVEQRLDALADMLNQLFLYTRIEAGELPLVMEKINAGNLFAETLSMFYHDFSEKGCEPHVQITKTPCQIRADRQAFVRIIENLIKNALVHGTGDYEMSLLTEDTYAVIRAANRTDSIEEADIACIFDRFYTTDLSRSRKTTGLGLAIVKELAQQMDGKASAALDGTTFSIEIRLPLWDITPDSDVSAQSLCRSYNKQPSSQTPAGILRP